MTSKEHSLFRYSYWGMAGLDLGREQLCHHNTVSGPSGVSYPDVLDGASAVQHGTLACHEFADYISNIVHRCANLDNNSCPSS